MRSRVDVIAPSLIGLAALAGFARATPPGIYFGDVAQFQLLGLTGGLAHANGYPVYITIANLFALLPIGPLTEAAYRVNLLSAVFGGLTVGLLALFVFHEHAAIDGRPWRSWIGVAAGIFAALAFALIGTTWALATVASPYTLDTATTLVVLILVGAWAGGARASALYAGLFVWGASFGGHDDTVLLAPGLAILVLSRLLPERRKVARVVPLGALSFLAGIALYLATWAFQDARNVSYDFMHTLGWIAPDTWIPSMRTPLDRFMFQATNQEWRWAFFSLPRDQVRANVAAYLGALPDLFTTVGVGLAAIGLVGTLLRRPPLGLALLLTFVAQLVFWMSYDIGDLPKHLLPSYLLVALWIGLGAAEVLRLVASLVARGSTTPGARSVGGTAVGLVVAAALAWLVLLPGARTFSPVATGQAPVDYSSIQWHVPSNLDEPEAYARLALSQIPQNAVIFATWKEMFTLAYVAQFQYGRHDVLITREDHYAKEAAARQYAAARPTYFVNPPQRWLPPDIVGRILSDPPLYALTPVERLCHAERAPPDDTAGEPIAARRPASPTMLVGA